MGEPEAIKAIKEGYVKIGDITYNVISNPSGSCDNCCFEEAERCPQIALNICCTGGNILKIKHI